MSTNRSAGGMFGAGRTTPGPRADRIDDSPLDGTELARVIAETVPGANRALRHAEWRADLKRRVRDRLANGGVS